jgi:hypothetical protein
MILSLCLITTAVMQQSLYTLFDLCYVCYHGLYNVTICFLMQVQWKNIIFDHMKYAENGSFNE